MIQTVAIILYGSIFSLLTYACWLDVKTRTVPNWISYSIDVLSIPLILNNTITTIHIISIIILISVYRLTNLMGGADLKVIVPLILVFPLFQLMIFFAVICIVGFSYYLITQKTSSPFFVSIFFGYIIAFNAFTILSFRY